MLRRLLSNRSGSSAAEFALVLPVAIAFFFGILDGGRYLWEVNRAGKATQAGARAAAVTDMIPQGVVDYSYVIDGGLSQGSVVDDTAFPGVQCEAPSGVVTCEWLGSPSEAFSLNPLDAAFQRIVKRMQVMMPTIGPENVVVTYYNSGLGFAGDPSGPDVAPLISVRLQNMEFRPILTSLFGLSWDLPGSDYTLTQEDGAGWCFEEMREVDAANDCEIS